MSARENTARLLRPDLFDRADLVVQTFAEYPTWLRFAYVIEAIGDRGQAAYERADEVIAIADADVRGLLADPVAVHLNMLRGGIAKPTPAQIGHIYRGDEALAVIAEVARQNEIPIPVPADLVQAVKDFFPPNFCTDNANVGDETTVPIDVSMGELRALKAGLGNAEAFDPAACSALKWLAENQNCELSYDYGDADDDGKGWCIHRVHGGRNDREWILIGTGETPKAAIQSAIATQGGL